MKKIYTIEVEVDEVEQKWRMKRTNDGFTILELMGITEMVQQELMGIYRNEIKADPIERRYVIEDKQ